MSVEDLKQWYAVLHQINLNHEAFTSTVQGYPVHIIYYQSCNVAEVVVLGPYDLHQYWLGIRELARFARVQRLRLK